VTRAARFRDDSGASLSSTPVDIPLLIEHLEADDPDRRRAAAQALLAEGPRAAGPLVAALRHRHSWDGSGLAKVLQQIGAPAIQPLVDALAQRRSSRAVGGGPSQSDVLGRAFIGLPVSDRQAVVALLSHPSGNVRMWACCAIAAMNAGAEPYLPSVLPLLTDEDPDVRYSACEAISRYTDESSAHLPAVLALLADPFAYVRAKAAWTISCIGTSAVPVLRSMRRSPGPHRRYALAGLAELVGWTGLDPADQALVQRLIGIKIRRELPEPFYPDGQWYAVPTSDQAAVLDAFDLSDPMPVTMRLGQAAASYGYLLDGNAAYVTPALDGWTLVFVWDGEFEDKTAALSRRFATAHMYVDWDDYHGCGYATGWCIAERGSIVRCYVNQDGPYEIGAPHPAEDGYRLPHEDADDADGVEVCHAMDIAARLSVSPSQIGPHTRIEGHSVLALTAAGRSEGLTPAALPI
jgi:HEAT repeat protein